MADDDSVRLPEHLAADILAAAMLEHRAAELVECLTGGGMATVDANNHLSLASGEALRAFAVRDIPVVGAAQWDGDLLVAVVVDGVTFRRSTPLWEADNARR